MKRLAVCNQCGTMCDSVKMDGVPETLHRNLFGDKDAAEKVEICRTCGTFGYGG